jgi:hypothetical protein
MKHRKVDPDTQAKKDCIDAARMKQMGEATGSREEPRLLADGNLKRCSVCGYPFEPDIAPSMSVAFAEHLRKAHQPGQTS